MKWQPVSEPVEAKCATDEKDIEGCIEIGRKMAEKVREEI